MSRLLLDKRTSRDLFRLTIFMVVTTLATSVLIAIIGNISFQSTTSYRANFTDVTGLNSGDDVRLAGVRVGTVKDIKVVDRNMAQVTFNVSNDVRVTTSTELLIRYRNLVGQRYVSLVPDTGEGTQLKEAEVIPVARTKPALDLTVLFNGFKPLFQALTPADVNELSYQIIQVFQGEGGNLQGLLQSTASITNTLADRDEVIGSLITNLNAILGTIGSRNDQLNNLLTQLRAFTTGLAKDRNVLLGPLDSISSLTQQTAALIGGIRPGYVQDVKNLKALAGNINRTSSIIDSNLQILPQKLNKLGRTAIYGSFFNFFLCQFGGSLSVSGVSVKLPQQNLPNNPARCHIG